MKLKVTFPDSWGWNWKLLSLWDSSLLLNKETKAIPGILKDILVTRYQNKTGLTPPEEGDKFIMASLCPGQLIDMRRATGRILLKAKRLHSGFQEDANNLQDWNNFLIIAWCGLAEIFATVVDHSDVLLIRGGLPYKNGDGEQRLALNLNGVTSEIFRVAYHPNLPREVSMCLAEKIEPCPGGNCFTFEHFAKTGLTSMAPSVISKRFKTFSIDEYWHQDVNDNDLTFPKTQRDFKMPISRGADHIEIRDQLFSSELSLSSTTEDAKQFSPPSNFYKIEESEEEDDYSNVDFELTPAKKVAFNHANLKLIMTVVTLFISLLIIFIVGSFLLSVMPIPDSPAQTSIPIPNFSAQFSNPTPKSCDFETALQLWVEEVDLYQYLMDILKAEGKLRVWLNDNWEYVKGVAYEAAVYVDENFGVKLVLNYYGIEVK